MRYVKDQRLSSMMKNRIEVWGKDFAAEKNRLGQRPKVEKKLFDIYAAVIPQTGSLLSSRQADTVLTKTTHKIICRYNPKLTSANWFMYKGERYNIIYIQDPYLNNERMECFCEVVI